MKTKAIITKKRASRTEVTALAESNDAQKMGFKVESNLPQGTLVDGEENDLLSLENQGYRVKILNDTNLLTIGNFTIDTDDNSKKNTESEEITTDLHKSWTHHLVQLIAPPTEEWVSKIEKHGVDVIEPISAYGLFVVGSTESVKNLKNLDFVSWVGEFKPSYRIAPNLEGKKANTEIVNIDYIESEDLFLKKLNALGAKIMSESEYLSVYNHQIKEVTVKVKAAKILEIAAMPEVRWIELDVERITEDERSAQIIAEGLNAAATQPVTGYVANLAALGLNGAGVTIAISDTGVDTNNMATVHPDLNGRLAFSLFGAGTVDTNGHGTHVAGIAAGNASTGETDPEGFALGQGVAPGSQIGALGNGDLIPNIILNASNNNCQVMNMSWRVNDAGTGYSSRDRDFDIGARDANAGTLSVLESINLVFSAGNSGPNPTTTTKESKNSILVGNSLNFRPLEGEDNFDNIMGINSSSSRGPAVDGRILPTIVAPGTDIVSTRSSVGVPVESTYTDTGGTLHNTYTSKTGTSMAAPHVSGLCALIIEWWRNRTGGKNPSPAMVKALLINGAIDIAGGPNGNVGTLTNIPNNNQGWGRVSLQNMVLQAPASDRGPKIFSDQRHAFTAVGQEHNLTISPVATTRPMRITLVWTDAPGAAGSNPSLVNDLDLEVLEVATGNIFKGNVFNNGFSVTGGTFDNRNNIECVYINNPSGLYEVNIVASTLTASANPTIATPWQDFALVIDNAEYAASSPVNIVPVIDRSGSMIGAGYVDVTKASSRQFVDLMNINDGVGIVSFGDSSVVEYSNGATLQTISGQPIKDAARTEIDGIAFGGCTFMGAGINEAANLLGTSSGSKAIVLLSDGYDNKGCDNGNPAKPSALDAITALSPDIPIYSCAMGPLSDQALLAQIGNLTSGKYYFMPTIDDLHEIYNYVRGQISGDSIIVNESAFASSSRVAGFVDALASELTFSVAWNNSKLRYVPRGAKKQEEISIRLRDPRGKLLNDNDSYVRRIVGNGYVIFKITDPMPGQWFVEVSTALETHTKYTVGGFVNSPIKMISKIDVKKVIAKNPFNIFTSVFNGDKQINQVRGSVQILGHDLGIKTILDRYKGILKDVKPNKILIADGIPADIAKIPDLQKLMFDKEKIDILNTSKKIDRFQADVNGNLTGKISNNVENTSYNLIVNTTGSDGRTKFIRKDMISVYAH